VTVHLSFARRDIEQRMIIAPGERLVLPGADRRFFAELLAALATASPDIARARLRLWFVVLEPDGGLGWQSRGALGLSSSTARRFPAGARSVEAIWPLLEENTLRANSWRQ
jgi:hypothetical protein